MLWGGGYRGVLGDAGSSVRNCECIYTRKDSASSGSWEI